MSDEQWSAEGTPTDDAALLALVYDELRAIASAYLRHERPGHTLQTTALVHEAYLRLARTPGAAWSSLNAFCAAAATAMRRILVDHARQRKSQKRGGSGARIELNTNHLLVTDNALDLVALDQALVELETLEPRAVRVVELRYFCGLTENDVAEALGLSRGAITKDWRFARAWLRGRLENDGVEVR